ncbi:pentatricopeptide repeat-containing protein At1g31790 [Silene latifolia]|uniref:pentatricopeptide repeat-containing protein At1g31790 n=1 Tax=Silene latifolia TaxID=37657 RepID=UPI003D781766
MDIKIFNSSLFTTSPCFPTFITHHRFHASSIKLNAISAPPQRLKSTLLRQPDYKPAIIPPPEEEPETIPEDLTDKSSTLDVLRLFDGLKLVVTPDVYASLIAECTRNCDAFQASQLYDHMKGNRRMVKYLKGSSGLLLFNRILMMFVICGCLDIAEKVFDEMPHRDSISVGILVSALVNDELYEQTLSLFVKMYECFMYKESYKALHVVVVCVLKACACLENVDLGKMVHGWLIKMGYGSELFVGIAFTEFYGKCRCLPEANRVFFHQIQFDGCSDTNLWTCAIVNNCRQENFDEVIRIFLEMGQAGVAMNKDAFFSVLKASGRVSDGSLGRQVHANAIKFGLDTHVFVMYGLVDMYGRCGLLADARKVFDMSDRNKRSSKCWNAMVFGLIKHGFWIEALKMLYQMKAAGLQPKQSLVIEVRMACGSESLGTVLSQGRAD